MTATELITATLAAESCWDPAAFLTEGVHLSELTADRAANPPARRFPALEDSLTITSMGTGVVVAATPQFVDWAAEIFRGLEATRSARTFSARRRGMWKAIRCV